MIFSVQNVGGLKKNEEAAKKNQSIIYVITVINIW